MQSIRSLRHDRRTSIQSMRTGKLSLYGAIVKILYSPIKKCTRANKIRPPNQKKKKIIFLHTVNQKLKIENGGILVEARRSSLKEFIVLVVGGGMINLKGTPLDLKDR